MSDHESRLSKLEIVIPRIDNNIAKIFNLLDGPSGAVSTSSSNKESLKRLWRVTLLSIVGFAGFAGTTLAIIL